MEINSWVSDTAGSLAYTITESTTDTVACGDSNCRGRCGLPVLVLHVDGRELRAFGLMAAYGPVFQPFRFLWIGEKVPVTLGDMSVEKALKRYWI